MNKKNKYMTNEEKINRYCQQRFLREGLITREAIKRHLLHIAKWKDKQFEKIRKEAKQSLWHSLDETPIFPSSSNEPLCNILVLYDNGNMFLYRYTKDGIPNNIGIPCFRNIINAKWCYCNDLIP